VGPSPSRPPLHRGLLVAIAAGAVGLHVVAVAIAGYGYTPDELYFLDCADRLDWGYVDHPPLSIALLAAWRRLFGVSLLSLRVLAALAGAAAMFFAGALAREMGGGRTAQGLAALSLVVAPAALFVTGYYSLNAVDLCLTVLAGWLLARLANDGDARLWLALGFVIGAGTLNKHSMLWIGAGVSLAIVLTPLRRSLATPWPWAAMLVAALVIAPHLAWQWNNHWPTLEFMRNGMAQVMVAKTPLVFVREQVRSMNPIAAPFVAGGLIFCLLKPPTIAARAAAVVFLTCFAILLGSGSARPYYLVPAYPLAFAAAGVGLEALARRRRWRWLPAVAFVLIGLVAAVSAPLVLPLLSPDRLVRYEQSIGGSRPRTEFEEGRLPVQLALQFGWAEVAEAVARALAALPADERARVVVLSFTFPDAAAVSFYRERLELPPGIGTHNNYWLWGPGASTGEVVLALAPSDEKLRALFASVEAVEQVRCDDCLPEYRKRVYLCRQPRQPLREAWPSLRDFS